jgi:hypothetical protein
MGRVILCALTAAYGAAGIATRKIGRLSLQARIAELEEPLFLAGSPAEVELRIDLPT